MAIDFSAKPYFDDYSKEKGFHKILFKPGVSVQARELNQIQEIIQQQIARLGTHIFKNGSMVIPGQLKLNKNASYVILENTGNDPELLTKLIGKKLYQSIGSNNLEAVVSLTKPLGTKVLAIISYTNSATKIVAGEVENVTKFSSDLSIAVDGEPSILISVAIAGPNGEPNVGKAAFLTIESGVFYVDGYFVHTETQTTLIGWNFDDNNPLNAKAGFIVKKEIVTAYDDPSLFDNATGSPNEGAPGADRMQILLELDTLPLSDEDTDFLEMVRFEDGNLRVIKQFSQYNVLEDTLARRTYDESGDYSVYGLDVKVIDHLKDDRHPGGYKTTDRGGDDNKIAVEISEGKAYVKGYEVHNPSNYYLEVNKARTTDAIRSVNNIIQVNENGEFIYLAPGNEFIDLSRHPIIWLTNGFENTSDIIGYCIPKHLEAFNISGQTIFKLFGSFYLSQSTIYGWEHIGGWKLNDLKNGPVLQKLVLDNVVSSFVVTDGVPLTSHPDYTPYAWDSANKFLYVKKANVAPVFDKEIQVVKGPASGYVSTIEFKYTFPDGNGDLIKFKVSNLKSIKDGLGNIELTADVGFVTTITTNASGYGEYNYLGDGVFTGQPVAAHTGIDNAYFSNIVTIENAGKRLVINNASYPNAIFSVSATLNKPVAIKSKSLAEGNTAITIPSGKPMVLAHKDVYKLKHVYVSANLATPATTADTDLVDYYELVNNDTVDFYQNTLLKAKQGFATPNGQLLVVYDYFLHSSGDAFIVDSYTSLRDNPADESDTTHIGRIPIFSTKDKTYILSDYLDFRQVPRDGFFILKGTVTDGSSEILLEHNYSAVIAPGSLIFCKGFASGTTVQTIDADKIIASANSSFPAPGTYNVHVVINVSTAVNVAEPFLPQEKNNWTAMSGQQIIYDAQYFVDRWDRVVYYKNGEIKYIYGIPDVRRFPDIPADAMSLATLIVPAYTRNASLVKYKKDDNRRYTMRDIGKLERRIENLEYYTTLTLKELETKDLKIVDENGLDRFKSGFFVSDFRDFGVFNPFGNNGFKATLVPVEEKVIPLEFSDSISLVMDQINSSNYVIKGDSLFLPYTEVVEIQQPFATASETINPYLVISWNTSMTLNPAQDNWIETEWEPSVTNVTNISNTIVNENSVVNEITLPPRVITVLWEALDPSIREGETVSETRSFSETRSTVTTSREAGRRSELLRTSVIPFIRSRSVRFSVKGAKPNTRFWAAFDLTDVNNFCRPIDPLTNVAGNWGDPIISDPMGNIEGEFLIPNNTFTTGTKTFSLADINVIEYPDAGTECEASATYTANGTIRTMREVIEITNTTTTTINRTNTVNRTIRSVVIDPTIPGLNDDPLAQSFFTTNIDAPGMFITKIDIYFRKKDPFAPVFLELRNMVNGYPVDERIPGSLVALHPGDVSVSEDSTVPTSFVFEKPIWLESKKSYCFVLMSNSSRYHIWISKMGEKVVNEERIIGEQPSLGSLFKSQNASTWTPFQLEDIKFRIHRAKFNTSTIANWYFVNNGLAARRRVNISNFYTESGSKLITVHHDNHGMEVNGFVKFEPEQLPWDTNKSPTSSDVFNGIPMSEIYGDKIVKEIVDINHYKIEVTTAANKTGYFEDVGRYLYIHSNINFYKYSLIGDDLVLPESEIRYYSSLITGKDFDGGQTPKVSIPEKEIKNHDINYLENVALVLTAQNETSKSMKIRAIAKTSSDYVSPILSLSGNSVTVASLNLNKPTGDGNEFDSNFENGLVASKIVTQKIRLKTNADSLRIITSENKQDNDDIEVYYRTTINRDLEEKTWTKIEPLNSITTLDTKTFIEHERRVDGIPEFDEFQIKIVFKGSNSVRHPSLKELRVIAVAG